MSEFRRMPEPEFDLAKAVAGLMRPESISAFSPYHKVSDNRDRFSAFRSLSQKRGRRYVECTLNSFNVNVDEQRNVVDQLKQFAKDMPTLLHKGNGGVILLGPPGTGKDHLLMGLMREAILTHGFSVTWVDGLRLFSMIKSAIKTDDVEDMLKEYVRVQVLAISDPVPPRDELTAYELAILRDLIERRYSQAMATWVTTNVQTKEDAVRLFTSAVLGRLLDGSTQLFCGWSNHRSPRNQ